MDELNQTFVNATLSQVLIGNTTSNPPSMNKEADCDEIARFVIYSVFAGSICLLGFVCNCVSCVALRRDTSSPVASLQLQALAVADNVFLALWFLHFSITSIFDNFFRVQQLSNAVWMYLRTYTYPLLYAAQTATIWLTVVIAASRYIAICVPYRSSSWVTVPNTRKAVLGVTLFSIIYNLPRFFENWVEHDERPIRPDNVIVMLYLPRRTWLSENDIFNLVYTDTLYYIFSFVLPLVLLALLNTRLTLAYRVVQRKRAAMRSRHDSHENNLTLVMIIVVLVFMLCNLPARIVQITWKYRRQACPTFPFFLSELSNVLEVLNSSTNFIIYCVFRQKFRDILSNRLCGTSRQVKSETDRDTCTTKIHMNNHTTSNRHAQHDDQEECEV